MFPRVPVAIRTLASMQALDEKGAIVSALDEYFSTDSFCLSLHD
jgi:hypothetical protein